MLKSKVSVRGQTVIPQEIREKLGIKPNSEVAWWVRDGVVKMIPIPEDPIAATRGMLKGSGISTAQLLEERRLDLEMENKRFARYLNPVKESKPQRSRSRTKTRAR
jgi:AbrB family looped-hinge helix DNA binding protein